MLTFTLWACLHADVNIQPKAPLCLNIAASTAWGAEGNTAVRKLAGKLEGVMVTIQYVAWSFLTTTHT